MSGTNVDVTLVCGTLLRIAFTFLTLCFSFFGPRHGAPGCLVCDTTRLLGLVRSSRCCRREPGTSCSNFHVNSSGPTP
jgi:hypothetical protein